MKLYELTEQYNTLRSLLDEEGADEEGINGQLTLITESMNDKAENIGKLILSLEGEAVTMDGEIKRLTARKQAALNKADWLKNYLLNEMLNARQDKIRGQIVTVAVRTNPPSVNVVNPDLIPTEYRRVIPETWQADKKAILDHVKATGEVIPGCEIVTDRKSLSIK